MKAYSSSKFSTFNFVLCYLFLTDTVLPESPDVFIINDTHMDDRFAQNSLVTGPPFIRFYAGAALIINDVKVC